MQNKNTDGRLRSWLQQDWRRWHPENLPLRDQLIALFLLVGILPAILLGIMVNWTSDRIIEHQVTDNTFQLISKVNQTIDTYMQHMQSITYLISFDPNVDSFMNGRTEAQAQADKPPAGSGSFSPKDTKLSLSKEQQTTSRPSANIAASAGDDLSSSELAGTAGNGTLSGTSIYQIRQFLQGFTTVYPEIAGILVVNSRGEYISNEMYARSPESLTHEQWYRQAVEHQGIFTIVGHPAGRNATNHTNYRDSEVISVARSLNDPKTGEVRGVVLIDLKLRVIAQAAKDVTLGKTGYLMVTDSRGRQIYAPEGPFQQTVPAKLAAALAGGQQNVFTEEIQGQQLQFVYTTSSYTGWKTVGVFRFSESVAEARTIRFYVVIFLFFVCLFGLTASYGLSRSISQPIYRLSSLMQKAEAGDMTTRYMSSRRDEVGMLGRSFNRMINEIRNLIQLNKQQEQQKREAELRSLQAHIRPHFLYNTLDTIQWMARRKGAEDISGMIDSLSKLFRIGLSRGSDIITLSEEEQHVRSYLQIQETRYRDRLNYQLEVDESIRNVYVIKLLLQPIVENAIYHGIKARRGPGTIHIRAEQQEDKLIYTVEDDGAGISEERLSWLRKQLEHPLEVIGSQGPEPAGSYGLLNIQARIHLAYGTRYGLTMDHRAGGGTIVRVTQPLLWQFPTSLIRQGDEEE
ncbi:cache domain-containing sensor histidine kinase [Paenibacillus bovis]|uniref:Histidine kinase n=1 Tax=Paenibacillus bovis TaxID=1616788 RepID=A0A172ZE44_9BACL|nr:sensor histidine kinase [Paenibacillus bovis]ANF95898.1 histidine kinase [Paenibacillus bovis]